MDGKKTVSFRIFEFTCLGWPQLKDVPLDKYITRQIEKVYAGKRRGKQHIEALENKKIPLHIRKVSLTGWPTNTVPVFQ